MMISLVHTEKTTLKAGDMAFDIYVFIFNTIVAWSELYRLCDLKALPLPTQRTASNAN